VSRASSEATRSKRQLALDVSATLAAFADVDAVVLFGSVARGDAKPSSDIDLMVVADHEPDPIDLRRRLPPDFRKGCLSLVCRSSHQFLKLLAQGDSFAAHLHREGVILHDRSQLVTDALSSPLPQGSADDELAKHLRRLRTLEDLRQFNGYFLFCYARLYGIAKSIVMVGLQRRGIPNFDRRQAFALFKSEHPAVEHEVDLVARLAPFYDVVMHGEQRALEKPYEGVAAERMAASVIGAIKAIARVA
jgi:hypothetical protein